MKQIVEKILRDKGLLVSDAEDIFNAMSEIMHEAAERTKINEPYATNSIRQLEQFGQLISDYDYFCENH
jgi:hypothetical protein